VFIRLNKATINMLRICGKWRIAPSGCGWELVRINCTDQLYSENFSSAVMPG
jgi:hypothetical protein